MPFNGSGSYSRLYSWIQDKANGIFIDSTRSDNELNGFATGLSNVICKDGQTTLTADIPWNGKKITGYGTTNAPSSRSDVPQLGQVQDATVNWVVAAGTADVITASYAPPITALINGQECKFRATAANATTTPTFSPSGLTAHTITKRGGSALAVGDIPGNLAEIILRYNLANTRWELLNPAIDVDGVAKVWGYVELDGTLINAKNIASAVRNSTGNYTVNFTVAFSTANYASTITPEGSTLGVSIVAGKSANAINFIISNTTTGAVSDARFNFVAFGRQ